MRADKFLFHHCQLGKRAARQVFESGALLVNGIPIQEASELIGKFDRVVFNDNILCDKSPIYILLHKPLAYVSATKDVENRTVMDLLPRTYRDLHLVGRLDKSTTGLVLLTNDSVWSRAISEPKRKQAKRYLVESEFEHSELMLKAFREGMIFEKERVKSQPAEVEILGPKTMYLTIFEGMHHQIKRMFLKFNNRVTKLHREQVGTIILDIEEGKWREISPAEAIKCAEIDPSAEQFR